MQSLQTLLSLPLAKLVLAFEAVPLSACEGVYRGDFPLCGGRLGGLCPLGA